MRRIQRARPFADALRSSQRIHFVNDEREFRLAIGLAASTQSGGTSYANMGHEIVIADTFTVSSPIVIPSECLGLRITSIGDVPLWPVGTVTSLFDVRASFVTITNVFAANKENPTGVFLTFLKIGAAIQRLRVINCIAGFVRQFIAETSSLYCQDLTLLGCEQTNYDSTATVVLQLHGRGRIVGCAFEYNGSANVLTVGSGAQEYSIVGTRFGDGNIDTSGGSGGSRLAGNTNVGTRTRHAADFDDDVYNDAGLGPAISSASSIALDFTPRMSLFREIDLSHNPTFTTSNLAAGRSLTLRLNAGGSARTLTWPSWIVLTSALPTSLASGKALVVSIVSWGTTDGDCVAGWGVEP